ncbi:hypothetical protein GCM10010294_06380 [Streptomyces griseoloalbus]|uniref:SDR family oxidoreductase n=1 Tax=Streptomyces griseoloalbus TaxID=67303 RepID=UPI00198F6567|nr:hypothetical protein GCM10010294_06380 [Streptomyces griseoloalbus]
MAKNPLADVLRNHWRTVPRAFCLRMAQTAAHAVSVTFVLSCLDDGIAPDASGTVSPTALVSAAATGIAATILWGALSDRWGKASGLPINSVAPGLIDTDITVGKPDPARKAAMTAEIRVGRTVADVIAFLARPSSAYLTGVTHDVNGGPHTHRHPHRQTAERSTMFDDRAEDERDAAGRPCRGGPVGQPGVSCPAG